jgi:NNP family nitrate/nitrite transporter-like MFS transporter
MNHGQRSKDFKEEVAFLSNLKPLSFLVGIFFLNMLSRVVLSPLMPTIEEDLKFGHDEAGSLFLLISLGYCTMLLGSGFISSRFNHRRTIILSSIAVGLALLFVGLNHSLGGVRFGLLLLGMAAGLYLPSGFATITGLVSPAHLGKAIGLHELAPNLGFMVAPPLAEALLGWYSWRGVLVILGIASVLAAVVFAFLGKGGTFLGEVPHSKVLRNILVDPTFWIMVILFTLGIGASLGVYSMIPLYLVSEKGMERTWVNTLLGLSRILTLGVVLLSGWVTDRLGLKQALTMILLANGVVSMLLGVTSESWMILLIFLQPILASSFFPPGFATLSQIGGPKFKNIAVSLTIPVSFLLGGGAIPAMIGFIGEVWSFSAGFIIFGGILLGGMFLVRYLKFAED